MTAPLRILHIHSGNMFGGIETILVTLARHHDGAAGLEHRFTLCYEGRLSAALHDTAAHVDILGAARVSRPWTLAAARRRLTDSLRRDPPDVTICHAPWSVALFGETIAGEHIPRVFWLHGALAGTHWLERWAKRRRPDCVICNSQFTASTLPLLYPDMPHTVLYAPVVPPKGAADRATMRAALAAPPDSTVVLQASRMEPWKGQHVLLEALGRLRNIAGWECWLAGGAFTRREARYVARLEQLAARLAISERVRFLGHRSDVDTLLGAADVYCQPNTGPEPFGIAFIEALYASLPVVTSGLGGATEIVTPECGMLVTPGDPDELAGVLRRLVSNAALRRRLAAGGPARARKLCDAAQQLHRLEEILRGVREQVAGSRE